MLPDEFIAENGDLAAADHLDRYWDALLNGVPTAAAALDSDRVAVVERLHGLRAESLSPAARDRIWRGAVAEFEREGAPEAPSPNGATTAVTTLAPIQAVPQPGSEDRSAAVAGHGWRRWGRLVEVAALIAVVVGLVSGLVLLNGGWPERVAGPGPALSPTGEPSRVIAPPIIPSEIATVESPAAVTPGAEIGIAATATIAPTPTLPPDEALTAMEVATGEYTVSTNDPPPIVAIRRVTLKPGATQTIGRYSGSLLLAGERSIVVITDSLTGVEQTATLDRVGEVSRAGEGAIAIHNPGDEPAVILQVMMSSSLSYAEATGSDRQSGIDVELLAFAVIDDLPEGELIFALAQGIYSSGAPPFPERIDNLSARMMIVTEGRLGLSPTDGRVEVFRASERTRQERERGAGVELVPTIDVELGIGDGVLLHPGSEVFLLSLGQSTAQTLTLLMETSTDRGAIATPQQAATSGSPVWAENHGTAGSIRLPAHDGAAVEVALRILTLRPGTSWTPPAGEGYAGRFQVIHGTATFVYPRGAPERRIETGGGARTRQLTAIRNDSPDVTVILLAAIGSPLPSATSTDGVSVATLGAATLSAGADASYQVTLGRWTLAWPRTWVLADGEAKIVAVHSGAIEVSGPEGTVELPANT